MIKKKFEYGKLGKVYDTGYESNILYYKDNNDKEILFKVYKDIIEEDSSANYLFKIEKPPIEVIRKNKENKLLKLSEINDESLVKVYDLIYDKDILMGYTMEKVKGKKFESLGSTKREKINYLTQIRDTMLRLNEKGIYIGDFSPRKFIITENGKVINIGIDNYRIDDLDFDTTTRYIRTFEGSDSKKELLDRYCYNMYALSILGNYALGYFTIDDAKLPLAMRNKENKEILNEMYILEENYQGKILQLEKKKN